MGGATANRAKMRAIREALKEQIGKSMQKPDMETPERQETAGVISWVFFFPATFLVIAFVGIFMAGTQYHPKLNNYIGVFVSRIISGIVIITVCAYIAPSRKRMVATVLTALYITGNVVNLALWISDSSLQGAHAIDICDIGICIAFNSGMILGLLWVWMRTRRQRINNSRGRPDKDGATETD